MPFVYRNPTRRFHGKRIDVLTIEVPHSKGDYVEQEVIDHPGAAVILPLLDKEHVILIRNERAVIQERLWELPAGTLELGEDPAECAGRELAEETGYRAARLTPLFTLFTTPGFCNEKLHIFLAEDLSYVGQNLDETEQIEVVPLPLTKTLEMIASGEICDAKTVSTLLYYSTFIHK